MLLIYLPEVSPRSKYIFDIIFTHEFGIGYNTTANIAAFENHTEEKINYTVNRIKDEFFIKNIEVPVTEKGRTKVLFPNNEFCDLGFDIFAATFYMVSRYEEYLSFIP